MILSTDIWVSALIRRAETAGAFATVVRKGDPRAGAVDIGVELLFRLGAGRPHPDPIAVDAGGLGVEPDPAFSPVEDLDQHRARRIDPDLWVVEVEDTHGRHFLTEPVDES